MNCQRVGETPKERKKERKKQLVKRSIMVVSWVPGEGLGCNLYVTKPLCTYVIKVNLKFVEENT